MRSVASVLSSTWWLVHLSLSEVRRALRTTTGALSGCSRNPVLVHGLLLHHNLVRCLAAVINIVVVDVIVVDNVCDIACDLLNVGVSLRLCLPLLAVASRPPPLAFILFLVSHGGLILHN